MIVRKNPGITDYFSYVVYPFKSERYRDKMITELEDSKLILFKNYKLDLDYELLNEIQIPPHPDGRLHFRISKLSGSDYLTILAGERVDGTPEMEEVASFIREKAFGNDIKKMNLFRDQIQLGQTQIVDLFDKCFPDYEVFKSSLSWRMTEACCENLHVDGYLPQKYDFHQVKMFINLDRAPRIWNTGDHVTNIIRSNYREYDLGQYRDLAPDEFLRKCNALFFEDGAPYRRQIELHHAFFETGDIWMGDTRLIPHQIFYGNRMFSYMVNIKPESMQQPDKFFGNVLDRLHQDCQKIAA